MNNISGNCKDYIIEDKIKKSVNEKQIDKDKKHYKEDKDHEKIIKEIFDNYYSLLQNCDKLYEISKHKEIYDLSVIINSCKNIIKNLKN